MSDLRTVAHPPEPPLCPECGDTVHPCFPCAEARALREPRAEPRGCAECGAGRDDSVDATTALYCCGCIEKLEQAGAVAWQSWNRDGYGWWPSRADAELNSDPDYPVVPLYASPPADATLRADAERFRRLIALVPMPPKEITVEQGWKFLDALQTAAIDAARGAE